MNIKSNISFTQAFNCWTLKCNVEKVVSFRIQFNRRDKTQITIKNTLGKSLKRYTDNVPLEFRKKMIICWVLDHVKCHNKFVSNYKFLGRRVLYSEVDSFPKNLEVKISLL